MRRRAPLAAAATLAAALALPCPAAALDEPRPVDPAEPHMRTLPYNPAGRTLLVGTVGRATVITFGPDEQVKRVVLGVENFWEPPNAQALAQSPLNNVLPLWAVAPGRTTLQVVTARHGAPDRVYQFAAEVRPLPRTCGPDGRAECPDDPAATYGLAFTYPADERARREAEAAEARRQAAERATASRARREAEVARDRLAVDFACRNWTFEGRGSADLVPDETCDDGQRTAFRYLGNRQVPSVFAVDASGAEQSVQAFARPANEPGLRGIWWIVPGVHRELRLRLPGGAVLAVYNRAYDPVGRNPGTGTMHPDVVRELAGQARR
ncbi:TrbG/VirB9 family P-type conjugative transfer protein [Roseicella aerolata]|uniref:TrbG/VirB9 family P-type conjugative transfer protein n=1 Tax=Roseicella aerolata TaxID=2883479 RepID=A0A9X1LCG4_9PROT|nr:TrbG/VirB9 family P-type conjugative transfer protein [Roseicella aerolata]MCB4824170.1 TrbG/VirB9 family P-type conjugative transfer protein [Roseicella aerolata]